MFRSPFFHQLQSSLSTKIKEIESSFIGLVLFVLLTGYISTTKWGKGRFLQTSIFSPSSEVQLKLQELIFDEGQRRILLARIFHNKFLGYGREFMRQYSSYFLANIFYQRGLSYAYSVPQQGLLYFSFLACFIAALIYLLKKNFPKEQKILIIF